MMKGKVYLVGAGPGDEGLITVKGLKAIQKAEVILYDRLLNPKLLESAPADCEFIFCGKLPNNHILKQEMINEILVQKALEGKTVVRLKGGDPGVFGRVGEEAEVLSSAKIPFEIIPGITSGIAAPLYAGIPVTHREYGVSFTIVTAHDQSKDGKPSIDWSGLVKSSETIAFYMGISNLSYICRNLIQHGKPTSTPVILIQWGTYGRQRTLQGTLADIVQKVAENGFTNPAITLVGDIVALREKLHWFEKKPLYGRQVLLARTGTEKSLLAQMLREQGADVIEFPKWVKREAPVNENILSKVHLYGQILFTSPESVNDFFELLIKRNIDIRDIKASLYTTSSKSIKSLKKRGFIGFSYQTMNRFGKLLVVGERNLNEINRWKLEQAGGYDVLLTSENKIDERFIPVMKQMIHEASIDTVIFPSSSSVDGVMQSGKLYGIETRKLLNNRQFYCMGKSSWERAVAWGIHPDCTAVKPGVSDLIQKLIETNMKAKVCL